MTPQERDAATKEILMRIHVITGWQMPANELILILIEEFNKKIIESYPNTNAEEITYAFRNKSGDIKEWGKSLNISLIDEVMLPYLEKRFEISRIEENIKQIEHKPDLQKIDQEFEAFKKTPLGKQFFPDGKDI